MYRLHVISDLALEESQAVISSLFPHACQKFCSFHVGQRFKKNWKKFGGNPKIYSRALDSIHDPDIDSIEELIKMVEDAPATDGFAKYLKTYYVGENAKWKPNTWCRYYFTGLENLWGIPGSNNGLESHWQTLKKRHKELRLGKTTIPRCIELLMMSVSKDERSLYTQNIEMSERNMKVLHPFFEKQRPDYYLDYVRPLLKIVCSVYSVSESEREQGWTIKEADPIEEQLGSRKGYHVWSGPMSDPVLFTFGKTTITCSGSGEHCVGFHARGCPCIHLVQLVISKTIDVNDLPEFYKHCSTHKPCRAIIETHEQNGEIPANWVSKALKILNDDDQSDIESVISSTFDVQSVSSSTRSSVRKKQVTLIDESSGMMCKQKNADLKKLQKIERELHGYILHVPSKSVAEVHRLTNLMEPSLDILTVKQIRNTDAVKKLSMVCYEQQKGSPMKYNIEKLVECPKRGKKSKTKEKIKSKINLELGLPYAYLKPGSNTIHIGDLYDILNYSGQAENISVVMNTYKEKKSKDVPKDTYVITNKSELIHYSYIIPLKVNAQQGIHETIRSASKVSYRILNMPQLKKKAEEKRKGYLQPVLPDQTAFLTEICQSNDHIIPSVTSHSLEEFEKLVKELKKNKQKGEYQFLMKPNYSWDRKDNTSYHQPCRVDIDTCVLKQFSKKNKEWLSVESVDMLIMCLLDEIQNEKRICFDINFSCFLNTRGINGLVKTDGKKKKGKKNSKKKVPVYNSTDERHSVFFKYDFLHHYMTSAVLLESEKKAIRDSYGDGSPMCLFTRKRLIDLSKAEIICIPIYLPNHFVLAWINMEEKLIGYIDRHGSLSLTRNEATRNKPEHLWTYSLAVWLDSIYLKDNQPIYNFQEFKIVILGCDQFPEREQQLDSFSCGPIMLTQIFMLLSQKKVSTLPFSHQNFENIRQQLGGLLYNNIEKGHFMFLPNDNYPPGYFDGIEDK